MDREATIEVSRITEAMQKMASEHFLDKRFTGEPFETSVSFGDDHPDRARLIGEELRIRLSEAYGSSRVHLSLNGGNYDVKIDFA
ncbi:hypothetical protein WCL09_17480 [Pseudomonas koreensis]|uniref:hypothetical protein n=1 Tax=Pseudomonas koreensis TaxID=198620 RepID=UPI000F060D09